MSPRNDRPVRGMTLGEYVQHRNGSPLGGAGSIRQMVSRSLGAGSFAEFWRHWNPIWGYGLKRFVHDPLRRFVPSAVAGLATFVVSGALHDGAVTLLRGSTTHVMTPWFLLLGIGAYVGRLRGMDLSRSTWRWRATINLAYLGGSLAMVLLLGSLIGPNAP